MMCSTAVVLSACLLNCAFALLAPDADDSILLKPKEIKTDGSADWSRVVGGSPASAGQFPYIASLRRPDINNSHFCGAVIISSMYLLTAEHCIAGALPSAIIAVVGTTTLNSGGTVYNIANIIYHPIERYDITLLRTASPIVGSSLVASIPIGSTNIGAGVAVTLSGWGRTSVNSGTPNDLQFINLRTIETTECAARHPNDPIHETHLCTFTQAGEGACFGDSGGPLVANGVLVGLVSWGRPCAVGYPDVFTRVSSFVSWIQENAT